MYCIPVHPGHKTSKHYFSCSCGTDTDLRKSTSEHVMPNLCFCILWDSSASEVRNVNALFFMLWWDRYRFDKKRTGTHYAELVFLHSMRYAGDIVHSGAFGARKIDFLFFILGWDRCGFYKKCVGTRYAELVFFMLEWDHYKYD
jgi:hypothetical protein